MSGVKVLGGSGGQASLSTLNRVCMLTSLTLLDNLVTASSPTNKVVIYNFIICIPLSLIFKWFSLEVSVVAIKVTK